GHAATTPVRTEVGGDERGFVRGVEWPRCGGLRALVAARRSGQVVAMRLGIPIVAAMLAACAPAAPGGARGGDTQACGGEARVTLDCASEVAYEGVAAEAGMKVLDVATAQASFEEK